MDWKENFFFFYILIGKKKTQHIKVDVSLFTEFS